MAGGIHPREREAENQREEPGRTEAHRMIDREIDAVFRRRRISEHKYEIIACIIIASMIAVFVTILITHAVWAST
jgi:hypothetical protein